jgi:hypothetical protein
MGFDIFSSIERSCPSTYVDISIFETSYLMYVKSDELIINANQ